MAKVKLNKLIKSLRGKIGDLVFREMPDGKIYVSSAPKKKRRSTPAQKTYRREIFPNRIQWAKMAQHEYPIYAELAADLPMITAYNLALKDISHPPVIHQVLREDGRILVNAWDEISVASVKVRIYDAKGRLVEAGDAVQQQKDWWEYTPTAAGRIAVTAYDIPGNQARMDLE